MPRPRRSDDAVEQLLREWGEALRRERAGDVGAGPPHLLPVTIAIERVVPAQLHALECLSRVSRVVPTSAARSFLEGYLSHGDESAAPAVTRGPAIGESAEMACF